MKSYDQEEVDAILERALRAQAKDGTRLTHEELVAAAAEVGIPTPHVPIANTRGARGTNEKSADDHADNFSRSAYVRTFSAVFLKLSRKRSLR